MPIKSALLVSFAFLCANVASANPAIRPLGGPDAAEQSPVSKDMSVSHSISHAISSSHTLSQVHGDVSVITTTDKVVYLRGTVSTDDSQKQVMSTVGALAPGYRIEDQLMTVEK